MDIDFKRIIQTFDKGEDLFLAEKVRIKIPDAEKRLRAGLDYFVKSYSEGENCYAKWSEPNYRPIVEWMIDNKGRGLLMTGSCGLGKTLIGKKILPLLIRDVCKKIVHIYNAQELNDKIDEILRYHLICIDDIGIEGLAKSYGNVRCAFSELCDAAEQKGKLLIITSNLTVNELEDKYGERTIDRLKSITKYVSFTGKSMRK